ncbi:MAG TPA: hypothetical protein VMU48_17315 [Terracidiphilus sp.]|nr:hypothetical protein [Terracidiphilus sp.]
MHEEPVALISSREDTNNHDEQVKTPEKVKLERITLEPIPSVGLLGLDKGSWHCGGGMGGL